MTATSSSTLRRLRPSVHIAPVADGLLFIGWQQTMLVRGSQSLSRLWDAVFPHLHDGVDVEQLVAALPESARPVARQVIGQLDENDFFLRDHATAWPEDADDVHPEHRRTREFLDGAAPDPAVAQERLRTGPVVVRGHGTAATHAARSLLRLGAGDVTVLDDEGRRELAALATEHGAVLRSTAPDLIAFTIDVDAPGTIGDGPGVGIVQLGDHAAIGPTRTGADDHGVAITLTRMRGRGDDSAVAPLPEIAARLAGSLAAMQTVHHLCGITTEYDGMAHVVDAERLTTTTHPVARRSSIVAEPLGTSPDLVDVAEAALVDELTDERTGVLPQVLPLDLPQTPLGMISPLGMPGVVGWAASGAVARWRAALEAARVLAAGAESRWWDDAGRETSAPSMVVTAAGSDGDGFLSHAVQRLVAAILADPDERARRLTSDDGVPLTSTATRGRVHDAMGRLRVRHDVGLVVTTSRIRGTDVPAVVELSDARSGAVLATVVSDAADSALSLAIDHVAAVLSMEAPCDSVPQLTMPPWVSDGEVTTVIADPASVLQRLCAPDETVVAGRWTAEPALDRLGVIGWVGLVAVRDATGGAS